MKKTKYVNCTPHAIHLNSGEIYESEGIARVGATFTDFDENGICEQKFGEVTGLPESQDEITYIVSAMVLSAVTGTRNDCVAPATGHAQCVRNDKGMILSVPGFVR